MHSHGLAPADATVVASVHAKEVGQCFMKYFRQAYRLPFGPQPAAISSAIRADTIHTIFAEAACIITNCINQISSILDAHDLGAAENALFAAATHVHGMMVNIHEFL